MKIFGYIINGKEADNFMDLSCAKKKEWIKANTNQQNDTLIEAFVKNVSRGSDNNECAGCNKEKNENISKGLSKEITAVNTVAYPPKDSGKGNSTVPRRSSRSKGK